MTSQVDVVNLALDSIKARATVTSINPSDGSLAANIASRQFQIRIDALSRAAHWNCLRAQQSLSLLKAAIGTPENLSGSSYPVPPAPWLYSYALPTNPYCLKARSIVPLLPSSTSSSIPLMTGTTAVIPTYVPNGYIPFIVVNDPDASGNPQRVILTNMSQAQLIYTARITDPNQWDALFLDAAIAVLASYLCLPVGGDKQLLGGLVGQAKEAIMSARIADGDEGTTRTDYVPDWITARSGGGWASQALPATNFEAMAFGDGTLV